MNEIERKNSTELMTNLFDTLLQCLKKLELQEEEAISISTDVTNAVISNWAGQQIYVPFNLRVQLSKRDISIYHEFNGRNHADLAKKYNLSVARIYRIIDNVRKDEIARRQIPLFIDDDK